MNLFEGMEIRTSEFLTGTVVERPQDRFVEYGPEDDGWLLKFGMAKVVTRPSSQVVIMDEPPDLASMFSLTYNPFAAKRKIAVMHPAMLERIKEVQCRE